MGTNGGAIEGTRAIALVGPAGAGKTSLAEAMLFAAGATDRLGSTANGSSVGDASPEARARGGSTELNLYISTISATIRVLDCRLGRLSADGGGALACRHGFGVSILTPPPPLAAPALRRAPISRLSAPYFVNRIDRPRPIRDSLRAQPMSVRR